MRSNEIQIKLDSLILIKKLDELHAEFPNFEFSYFGMSNLTFSHLSNMSNEKVDNSGLLQGHPLLNSKYLNNNVVKNNNVIDTEASHIMTLMVKQTGGSRADDVQIDYDAFDLNSKLGFSFQSDIINLLEKLNAKEGQFRLGQISPNQSVVIPLFTYDKNQKGANDSYYIKGTIYVPKFIQFAGKDGIKKKLEIRKMLENPFSITVDIDERG
jgi:hypothetical protein